MASGNCEPQFPPESQPTQPAKEYLMQPLPLPLSPKPYKPSDKLLGKVALVTGGDSGIGRSVCLHFAMEGATVGFTYVKGMEDVDKDETIRLIKQIKRPSSSRDPIAIAADLGNESECQRVVDEFIKEYGTIDILVNNAAIQYYTDSIDDITESRLENIFRTNIFAFLPHGEVLTESHETRELMEQGIRVNAVAPGPVWTPIQVARMPPERSTTLGCEVPMKRAAEAYEIAPSYVFLASDDCSSYFTGQVLHPNGGLIVNA